MFDKLHYIKRRTNSYQYIFLGGVGFEFFPLLWCFVWQTVLIGKVQLAILSQNYMDWPREIKPNTFWIDYLTQLGRVRLCGSVLFWFFSWCQCCVREERICISADHSAMVAGKLSLCYNGSVGIHNQGCSPASVPRGSWKSLVLHGSYRVPQQLYPLVFQSCDSMGAS